MTVSTKAAHTWHAGFQISKTVRCFWHTCMFIKAVRSTLELTTFHILLYQISIHFIH